MRRAPGEDVVDGLGPPLGNLGLLQSVGGHQNRVQRIAQIVTENGDELFLQRRLITKSLLQRLPAPDVAVDHEQDQSEHQETTERRDIDPQRGVEIASRMAGPLLEAAVLAGPHLGDQLSDPTHQSRRFVRANDVQRARKVGAAVEDQGRAQLGHLLRDEGLQHFDISLLHGIVRGHPPQVGQLAGTARMAAS